MAQPTYKGKRTTTGEGPCFILDKEEMEKVVEMPPKNTTDVDVETKGEKKEFQQQRSVNVVDSKTNNFRIRSINIKKRPRIMQQ